MRKGASLSKALFVVFIPLLTSVVYAIGTKSVPLWMYIPIVASLGLVVSLILFLSRENPRKELYIIIALLLVTLLNYHALATSYSLLFSYDTYSEYVHFRIIEEQGHIDLDTRYLDLAPSVNPALTPNYPLLGILSVTIGSTANLKPMTVALLLPMVLGIVAMLAVVLVARILSAKRKNAGFIVALAAIAFIASPDMIYFSSNFYHRGLSLSLLFLTLYLAVKYLSSGGRSVGVALLLSLLLTTAPLAYSYYPNVYAVFFLWAAVLTVLAKKWLADTPHTSALRMPLTFFLVIFIAGFLWNFLFLTGSPITRTLPRYAVDLASFNIGAKELLRVGEEGLPNIPGSLRPLPWIYFLHLRDLLLVGPAVAVGLWLAAKFCRRTVTRRGDLIYLVVGASFIPLVITDYLSGWRPSNVLFYGFPMIGYSLALALAMMCGSKKRLLWGISMALVAFLVAMAFVSPFWHLYYPRQLYDPVVEWQEVGFPNPSYLHLSEFLDSHQLGEGYILSDEGRLLVMTLPLEDLSRARELPSEFGRPNTYVVVFVGLQPRLGYNPPGTGETMEDMRGEIDHSYSKILDAGAYSLYEKGN